MLAEAVRAASRDGQWGGFRLGKSQQRCWVDEEPESSEALLQEGTECQGHIKK